MIVRFRHKGLRRLYEKGDRRLVPSQRASKIERILARLDVAAEPADMNLPGFQLHPLRGDLAGFWAVSVSGNWRIIFRFEAGNVRDVDLVDYHKSRRSEGVRDGYAQPASPGGVSSL